MKSIIWKIWRQNIGEERAHTEFWRQNGLDSVLSSSLSWKLRGVDLASADREKRVRDGIGYRCLSQYHSSIVWCIDSISFLFSKDHFGLNFLFTNSARRVPTVGPVSCDQLRKTQIADNKLRLSESPSPIPRGRYPLFHRYHQLQINLRHLSHLHHGDAAYGLSLKHRFRPRVRTLRWLSVKTCKISFLWMFLSHRQEITVCGLQAFEVSCSRIDASFHTIWQSDESARLLLTLLLRGTILVVSGGHFYLNESRETRENTRGQNRFKTMHNNINSRDFWNSAKKKKRKFSRY